MGSSFVFSGPGHGAFTRVHSRSRSAVTRVFDALWTGVGGWWLALGHFLVAIVLALTIIGIPFAWAHLKLAGLALWPIGKVIVPIEQAQFGFPPRR
jgi:uncharacterized membrane protein YccF (DUF307 family)